MAADVIGGSTNNLVVVAGDAAKGDIILAIVVATVVTILMGAKLFKIQKLTNPEDIARAAKEVAAFDENDGIESKNFFWFGAVTLVIFIGVIATTSILPFVSELGMGYVALGFAVIMLIRFKSEVDQFYKQVDWDLIGFFMALFVVINVMEHAMVLELIGKGITKIIGAEENLFGTGALLVSSAAFSSVTDNIPLAAMLAKILGASGTPGDSPLWWAVVFGANLGGNITPIGSASTLVAVTIIHKYKLPMSFGGFVKMALPYAGVQLVLATAYVLIFLR